MHPAFGRFFSMQEASSLICANGTGTRESPSPGVLSVLVVFFGQLALMCPIAPQLCRVAFLCHSDGSVFCEPVSCLGAHADAAMRRPSVFIYGSASLVALAVQRGGQSLTSQA